jgi:NAD(P)-dependent dehydrogenase (short-subunit alcohol dehydrogenase family)
VAGASRGIGAAIAATLARAGASVAVAARTVSPGRLPGTIHSVAEAIAAEGGRAVPVVCDVTDEASVEAAVASAAEQLGGIDILVANAGTLWLAPTLDTPLRRWERVLQVNLTGVFLVTKAVLPHVIARGGGSLVAITTSGVTMTDLGSNAYWVSKAGVERYYTGLASELRPHNIAVNCLAPTGVVITEGWQAGGGGAHVPPELVEDASVIARAAVILAAQDASGITGTIQRSQDLVRT